jgi:hypothetical protein
MYSQQSPRVLGKRAPPERLDDDAPPPVHPAPPAAPAPAGQDARAPRAARGQRGPQHGLARAVERALAELKEDSLEDLLAIPFSSECRLATKYNFFQRVARREGIRVDRTRGLDKFYLGGNNLNSRRHTFSFAVYYALFGLDTTPMEEADVDFVAEFWKAFVTTCGRGVRCQNGTGNGNANDICVCWRHYRTRPDNEFPSCIEITEPIDFSSPTFEIGMFVLSSRTVGSLRVFTISRRAHQPASSPQPVITSQPSTSPSPRLDAIPLSPSLLGADPLVDHVYRDFMLGLAQQGARDHSSYALALEASQSAPYFTFEHEFPPVDASSMADFSARLLAAAALPTQEDIELTLNSPGFTEDELINFSTAYAPVTRRAYEEEDLDDFLLGEHMRVFLCCARGSSLLLQASKPSALPEHDLSKSTVAALH